MEPFGSESCLYEDRIEFALPGGRLSELALGPLVHFMLGHMFARRHRTVRELFVDRRDAWLRRAS
jgi:ligand-binding SRPBCC domain-containing protein